MQEKIRKDVHSTHANHELFFSMKMKIFPQGGLNTAFGEYIQLVSDTQKPFPKGMLGKAYPLRG